MPSFRILTKSGMDKRRAELAKAAKSAPKIVGKTVRWMDEGVEMLGVVKSADGGHAEVRLAIPDPKGVLMVGELTENVPLSSLAEFDGVTRDQKFTRFNSIIDFGGSVKAATEIKNDEGHVVDYRDVVIEGYASTFVGTTEADRIGDYVLPNAFDRTIAAFKMNPVMLCDHQNSVHQVAGSYSKIGTDARGLMVRGNISNAPDMRNIRVKIMEGHIRAFSIGGLWMYLPDGRGIEEAILFEISLVAVPMNQDALFSARSATIAEIKRAKKFLSFAT